MSADWKTVSGQLPYEAKELEVKSDDEFIIIFNDGEGNHHEVSYIFDIKEVKNRIKRYLKDGTIKDGKYAVIQRSVSNKVVLQQGFEVE